MRAAGKGAHFNGANCARAGAGTRVPLVMEPPKLPQELNQIVDFLAYKARGYGGKLQLRELQRFKSDLIEVPQRWTVAHASARSFERQCLAAGLSPADTDDLVTLLRRAQRGERMRVTSRFDRGHRYDLAPDWTPPDQNCSGDRH